MARSTLSAALFAVLATLGCNLPSEKPMDPPSVPSSTVPSSTGGAAPAGPAPAPSESSKKATEAPAREEAPAAKPAAPPREYKALTPECAQLLKRIQDLDAAIPLIFLGVKRTGDEIYKDILACEELSKQFLSECPGTEGACEVKGIRVRVRLAGNQRYKEHLAGDGVQEPDLSELYKDYMDETKQLAEVTAAECPAGSKGRTYALRALMEYDEKGFRFAAQREKAETIRRENPTFMRPSLIITIAQSFIYERKYAEAVKFVRDSISKYSDDLEYVVYNEKLLDALTGVGDYEGMEELMHLIRAEYPSRVPKVPEGHYLREQYVLWQCISGFWLGVTRMCRGDMEGARRYFKEQVAAAEAQKLAPGVAAGNNICNIYANLRSDDMIYWLDTYFGKPAQTDLALEDMWATPKSISLSEAKGKVVAILGRLPENRRAESFLQRLDELAIQHGKDGLVVVELGFLGGTRTEKSDAEMLEKMRVDLKKSNVAAAYAGYDPDSSDRKIFQALHLTVGTASFVVLDRQGRPAWYWADPRDMDKELMARVIERLLAEKPPEESKK